MQGNDNGDLLCTATLYDMLESMKDEKKRHILNGLDFLMGDLSLLSRVGQYII
jgi:hypothetical protein